MDLREKISRDLTAAMKARQADRLNVLRLMKSAVRNKEIETLRELDDAGVIQVLASLINQRKDSIEQFNRGGRFELSRQEEAEIRIIEEYLPEAVTDEEMSALVDEVVRESGASSPRDMGQVMKLCKARMSGKLVDGKKMSALVRERLESIKP